MSNGNGIQGEDTLNEPRESEKMEGAAAESGEDCGPAGHVNGAAGGPRASGSGESNSRRSGEDDRASREAVLHGILQLPPYNNWSRVGGGRLGLGAWRDNSADDNPHIQLDGLGLWDFRAGSSIESLWQLGRRLGVPGCGKRKGTTGSKKKSKASSDGETTTDSSHSPMRGDWRTNPVDDIRMKRQELLRKKLQDEEPFWWITAQYPVIHDYFSRVRAVPLPPLSKNEDDECLCFFRNLGAVVQDYELEGKRRCEIVIPLLGLSGELVECLKIELHPETNEKIAKRLLFGADRPRAITFGPMDAHEAVVIEGIEDALSLRFSLEQHGSARSRYVVSCGANGYQFVNEIIEQGRPGSIVVVCDADKGGEGIRKSAVFGEGKAGRILRFAPEPSRGDANDAARKKGKAGVEEWFLNLRRVDFLEVEELAKAQEEKELVMGETDSHEFHRLRYPDTDAGAAKFFVMRFGKRVRITEDGRWWTWSGRVWQYAHAEGQIRHWIGGLAPVYEREAQKLGVSEDVAEQKAVLLKFAKSLGSTGRQGSVMKCIEGAPEIQCVVDDFDARPELLNVKNGVLNLDSGELLRHAPELMCSKIAKVEWSPTATAPTWDRFLEEITCGDKELLAYKLRQLGYVASGYTHEKAFFFHIGDGDNGKSVEADVIHYVLGNYVRTVSTELFMENRFGTADAQYELADLSGVRVVVASETDENRAWSEANLKKFTGGSDALTARQIRQAPFTFQPRFKPVVHGNNRPKIKSGDPALWKRLHMVPYEFTATDPDFHLGEKLKAEGAGVLRRIYEGFVEWRRAGGLRAPSKVIEARDEYRAETVNDIEQFLENHCVIAAGSEIEARKLYNAYALYCKDELRIGPKTQNGFGRELSRNGIARRKSNGKLFREGIRLLEDSPGKDTDDFNDPI